MGRNLGIAHAMRSVLASNLCQVQKLPTHYQSSNILALVHTLSFYTADIGKHNGVRSMNWTGGRLQRHKQAGKGLIHKQKAFFAKQRTKLHNSRPSAPPIRTPFAGDLSFAGTVAPLAGIDSSALQRKSQSASKGLQTVGSQRKTNMDESRNHTRKSEPINKHNRFLIKPYSRDYISSKRKATHPTITTEYLQQSKVYTVRPQHPHKAITEENDQLSPSERQTSGQLGELEEYRQRLLQQSDWLDLAPKRPLQVQFPSQKKRHGFGKRRKLNTSEHTRDDPLKMRLPIFHEVPFGKPPLMSGALGGKPHPVHVRLGPDALATRAQSSEQGSAEHPSAHHRDLSPDSMLLDAEGEGNLHSVQHASFQGCGHSVRNNFSTPSVLSQATRQILSNQSRGSQQLDDHARGDRSGDNPLLEATPTLSRDGVVQGQPSQVNSVLGSCSRSRSSNVADPPIANFGDANDAWRALLALPSETPIPSIKGSRRQHGPAISTSEGSRQGSLSAKCLNPEIQRPGVEAHTQTLECTKPYSPGLQSKHAYHYLCMLSNHPSQESTSTFWGIADDREEPLHRSSPAGSEELWKKFVFGNSAKCEMAGFLQEQASARTENDISLPSTWSVASLASRNCPSEFSARKFGKNSSSCVRSKATSTLSSEDPLITATSTYNSPPESQLTGTWESPHSQLLANVNSIEPGKLGHVASEV